MHKKIDLDKASKEELQRLALESSDKTELAKKLGFTAINGKVHKRIVGLLEILGVSIEHFDRFKKLKARRKYPLTKKNCPVCGVEFETQLGHPKEKETCSCKCSNIFFSASKHSPESNKKRSVALLKYFNSDPALILLPRITVNNRTCIEFTKNCLQCSCVFKTTKSKQIFCSNRCAALEHGKNPVYIEKLRVASQKRIADGSHKGWATRSKLVPSFPEKVVIDIFFELGLQLSRELKISKWFIDFADVDRKIAVEIDGKQHELPERIISDANKDAYLLSQGWQVHRIKWKKLTKESRAELKEKLRSILIG
jgi:hypothetical protein